MDPPRHTNQNMHCRHYPGLYPHQFIANRNSSLYETDEFRMYKYKVIFCARQYSHDWTSCPFTHQGERACRRDPHAYLPLLCPFFKNEEKCRRGEACKFAHGLFEYFLHPGKYKTTRCINGGSCDRRVCFFAHSEDEVRDEWDLSCEEIHAAFEFNADMPVAIAPRQVLRALSARARRNNNTTSAAAAAAANSPATNSAADSDEANDSDAANPLSLDFSSPASIWSAALNSWPHDFNGLAETVREMARASRNRNQGEAAPVQNQEYRLWN